MKKKILLAALAVFVSFSIARAQDEPVAQPQTTPKVISGGVVNGKATSLPKPAFPAAAKAVRASGAVNVQVTIDENGDVISASAVSGHPLLRASAVQAAQQAKFAPTRLQGQPVKVTGVIVYNFVLPSNSSAKSDSQKVFPVGLSMYLTFLKEFPPDEEGAANLKGLADELPENLASEKAQIYKLIKARPSEQPKIIDETLDSLRKKSTDSENWMIDVGRQWGMALGQAAKLSKNQFRGDRLRFINSLQEMNRLLEAPPGDIPPDVLDKIRGIAAYNDESDVAAPEFIENFIAASMNFLEFMSRMESGESN
jgi:TonB family protein